MYNIFFTILSDFLFYKDGKCIMRAIGQVCLHHPQVSDSSNTKTSGNTSLFWSIKIVLKLIPGHLHGVRIMQEFRNNTSSKKCLFIYLKNYLFFCIKSYGPNQVLTIITAAIFSQQIMRPYWTVFRRRHRGVWMLNAGNLLQHFTDCSLQQVTSHL